ncbi:hypothetical protein A2W16_02930 [Candidatus Amesbacteria bacterium RBG_16_48_31]|nr:MAG: hypothetical protein A2W16_02930 [Candidatus Amesbacteria bacterium RBG_16_48_31]
MAIKDVLQARANSAIAETRMAGVIANAAVTAQTAKSEAEIVDEMRRRSAQILADYLGEIIAKERSDLQRWQELKQMAASRTCSAMEIAAKLAELV